MINNININELYNYLKSKQVSYTFNYLFIIDNINFLKVGFDNRFNDIIFVRDVDFGGVKKNVVNIRFLDNLFTKVLGTTIENNINLNCVVDKNGEMYVKYLYALYMNNRNDFISMNSSAYLFALNYSCSDFDFVIRFLNIKIVDVGGLKFSYEGDLLNFSISCVYNDKIVYSKSDNMFMNLLKDLIFNRFI